MLRPLLLVHDQEQLECLRVPPSAVKEPVPGPAEEKHSLPGSSRRNWVYRAISQLGEDAAPWVERD